jgi:hypothetical protein
MGRWSTATLIISLNPFPSLERDDNAAPRCRAGDFFSSWRVSTNGRLSNVPIDQKPRRRKPALQ